VTAQKQAEPQAPKPAARSTEKGGRKPWKKKTPTTVVLEQIDRLRDDVTKKEEELKQAKKQLQKLEEVRKVLEST
jgi:translation elongation factor EF-G